MGLIDNFFDKKIKESYAKEIDSMVSKLNTGDDNSKWTVVNPEWFGSQNVKTNMYLKEYMEWNYANISAIARAVADIDFKLYKYDEAKDEVEEVKEHPVLELLFKVNPSMTKTDFIYILDANISLAGEAPIRLRRKTSNPKEMPYELYPINPSTIKVFVGATQDGFEMVTNYELSGIGQNGADKIDLKPWELILMKDPNPNNHWRGVGVIEAASRTIDTLNFSEQYNLNFFKNSAVPYTVLYTEQILKPATIERMKEAWKGNYQGIDNAFKTAILEQGLKMERLQTSNKDMDFLEQQKWLRDKLMAMYKTTKIVLGITEGVIRANAEASEYVFMKYCVRPRMKRLVEYLNEFLLPMFDPDGTQGLFLDFEDPVQQDKTVTIQQNALAVNKWRTINEVRDEEGRLPVEGGDVIYQVTSILPLGTPAPTPPKDTLTPEQDVEEELAEGDNPIDEPAAADTQPKSMTIIELKVKESDKKKYTAKKFSEQIAKMRNRNVRIKMVKREFKKNLAKIIKTIMVKKQIEIKYKDCTSIESKEKFAKTQITTQEKYEKQFITTVKDNIYTPQSTEIIKNIKKRGIKFMLKAKVTAPKSVDGYMFDKDKWVISSIDIFKPLMEALILEQGQEAMDLLGNGFDYSMLETARVYLNKSALFVSKSVTETIFDKIRSSLAEGLAGGDGEAGLIQRVLDEYSNLETYQAQAIARTEVSRATNFSNIDAYKQSGVVDSKQWLTAEDEKVCEICASMDGQTVGIDEQFDIEGDMQDQPPAHVNCRCDTLPVLGAVKLIKPKEKSNDTREISKETEDKAKALLDEIEKQILEKELEEKLKEERGENDQ